MYQGSSTKQCLICHKELNQQQDLFHLVNNSSLCLSCIRKFKIINSDIRIQGYHVKVLYEYNDFFRQLLFQYKALDDYALKDCFIESFQGPTKIISLLLFLVVKKIIKDVAFVLMLKLLRHFLNIFLQVCIKKKTTNRQNKKIEAK